MKRKTIWDRELKWSELFPLACILGIVPLLYREIPYEFTADEMLWRVSTSMNDLYSIVKVRALLFFTVIAVGIFIYQVAKKRLILERSPYLIGVGIYAATILLSTLTSPFDTAVWGYNDRFEGMWVLLAYVTIFVISLYYGRQEKAVRRLVNVFLLSSIILCLIGFLQFVGRDPYSKGILRYLSFPPQKWDILAQMFESHYELGVAGSHSNPNYMGSYAVMATLLSMGRLMEKNRRNENIFLWIANCVAFSALIGSRSSAGLVGLIAGFVLMVFFIPMALKDNKKKIGMMLVAWTVITIVLIQIYAKMWDGSRLIQSDYLVLCVYLLYFVSAGVLYRYIFNRREKNRSLIAISVIFLLVVMTGAGFLYSPVQTTVGLLYDKEKGKQEKPILQDLKIEGEKITIVEEDGKEINFISIGDQIQVQDGDGNRLEIQQDDPGHYSVLNQEYEDYQIHVTKFEGMGERYYIHISKFDLWVLWADEGFFYRGFNYLAAEIDYPPRMGFEGNENFATKRGYIWSRTLPLIKDYILIGAGPDSFALVFPQYEHVAKWNLGININAVCAKAHNWYLQMAVNTGLVSSLSVMAMGFLLLFQSIKKYMVEDQQRILLATLSATVFAYAAAGLFNDSVVSVAPVFWIFFGVSAGSFRVAKMKAKAENQKGKKTK